MFGLSGVKLVAALLGPVALIAVVGGLAWSRANWIDKYELLSGQAGEVLYELRIVSQQKNLKWADAAQGVRDVGKRIADVEKDRDDWKNASEEQTKAIDRLSFDTERMKRLNAELRAKAQVELNKRQAAYDRLDAQASDPGDRADCIAQIKAAEAALDAIYEAGL